MSEGEPMSFDFSEFSEQTQKVIDHFIQEVGTLRTGRANVQLLDPVQVEAYGARMKINEVASVSAPESNLLVVSPWDKSLLGAIEKGINEANLNLNPVVDGQIVRIVIPALTQERRQEMVKLLHQKLEGTRAMLRSVRTDAKRDVEKQKGEPGISEDMIEADLAQLEEKFKAIEEQIESISKRKETELMSI
jgi:ribosome recycling factor